MSLINQFFSTDHRRLDCLFEAFKTHHPHQSKQSVEYFKLFRKDLIAHINWEEEILFPLIEELMPMAAGPTQVMRSEHLMIRNLLDNIQTKLTNEDITQLPEIIELEHILSTHNLKEENVLYPLIDQQISQRQLASIFSKLSNTLNIN